MIRSPFEYLTALQQKPESTRKVIVAVSVVIFMLIIISVWVTLSSIVPSDSTPATNQQSPLLLLWNYAKDLAQSVIERK